MDKEIVKELKAFRKKYHLSRLSWELVLDFLLRVDLSMEGPNVASGIQFTKADEERMTRLCNFMADMIAKYGKEEVIRQIEEAA